MIKDPRMNARWLRTFLSKKGVRKPRAKWDLTDSVLLIRSGKVDAVIQELQKMGHTPQVLT